MEYGKLWDFNLLINLRSEMVKVTMAMLLILFGIIVTSCSAEIQGIVIDAEKGNPISGAIVLVQWTKTKGLPGINYHKADEIIESETDKKGRFSIPGAYKSLTDPPIILIYKSGYLAWRNDYIFPSLEKNTHFKYQDNFIVKLERFKKKYRRDEHHSFMGLGIIGDSFEVTPKYSSAKNDELGKALVEIEQKINN